MRPCGRHWTKALVQTSDTTCSAQGVQSPSYDPVMMTWAPLGPAQPRAAMRTADTRPGGVARPAV